MSKQAVRSTLEEEEEEEEEEEALKCQCCEKPMVKACDPMKIILPGVSAAEVLGFLI